MKLGKCKEYFPGKAQDIKIVIKTHVIIRFQQRVTVHITYYYIICDLMGFTREFTLDTRGLPIRK